jgi:hypothetical protein
MGAIRANNFPRHADECGQAAGNHARSQTDPDNAERDTGNYGSEGWGFESLRARHCFRRSQRFSRRTVLAVRSIWPDSGRIGGLRSSP